MTSDAVLTAVARIMAAVVIGDREAARRLIRASPPEAIEMLRDALSEEVPRADPE